MPSNGFVNTSLVLLSLSAMLFAGVCGGKAERQGAGIWLLLTMLTWTVQGVWGVAPTTAFMMIDCVLALSFGWIALRFPNKLWPGLAGCAQFLVLIFSVTRAVRYPLSQEAYIVMLNLSGLGVTCALIGGTWASRWWKPRRDEWEEFAVTLDELPPTRYA